MDIGTQIKKLRKERKYTQAHLAELLGTKPTTVASWEQGRNKPLMDKVQKMSIIFGVPISDIVGDEESGLPTNIIYPEGLKRVTLPIIGEIACGDPITAEENIEGYTEVIFDKKVPSGPLFALHCKGHSMEPTIPDGSMVVIKSQPTVEDGEIAAVLVDNDSEATLKRIKHQGDLIMLMPDNKEYDPIILDKDHPGRIVGKAIRYTASLSEED
ncbi:XRE family transcriptional regulator [Limosilactobacillus reuteri]|uniref:LexA family protein n=1 Tax=Limosilactobacillus reuteri TaxID=1598 RepID=UPI001E4035E1|nr:XRE family transcriptional regulator [Limosilactobacillus reuteri]MCC4347007.1 XRE family transcriptional regulator [Limosilactobacillus reuteri]MCC4373934.1 XRE family transcriptional regulator [Limosilactobacillus reuteri]MCC4386462.1 XRE family transcriptional regulator [Limosilactobacillus reuteri]